MLVVCLIVYLFFMLSLNTGQSFDFLIEFVQFAEMIKQLGEKHKLPLKTGFNATRGFFVQVTLNRDQDVDLKSLPSEFLKAVKIKSVISFTTVDLVRYVFRESNTVRSKRFG